MPNHCCIPKCNYSTNLVKRTGNENSKKTIFTILRPDLAKNETEKQHRTTLTNIVLSLRDSSKGDKIKEMLHKESAGICEGHFRTDDFIIKGKRKRLKMGAIPCINMPKQTSLTKVSVRKAPAQRQELKQKVRFPTQDHLVKAAENLSSKMKSYWKQYTDGEKLIFELQRENFITPVIRMEIVDMKISLLSMSGWRLRSSSFPNINLQYDTLYETLCTLEKLALCEGVSKHDTSIHMEHPILVWKNDKIIYDKCYIRPLNCNIVVSNTESKYCSVCCKYKKTESLNSDDKSISQDNEEDVSKDFKYQFKMLFGRDYVTLNDWQKLFYDHQIYNVSVAQTARRYHPDIIRWCIELYARSPTAYDHIRISDVLMLPHPSTIRKYRNCISPESGINEGAISEIERVMKAHTTLCGYLTFDEMKIKENLIVRNGKIVGFVDWESCKVATHILAWYPTTVTSSDRLALIFYKILYECESRGLQVHAVVADGLNMNRKFFKLIANAKTIPLDSTTVRNSLYSSKPGGVRYMNKLGKDILWSHIVELYNMEKSMPLASWTRLTAAHIQLNSYNKMKVGLARDVLSWKVGNALKLIDGTEGTSEFVLLFDRWFDIMTCKPKFAVYSPEDKKLDWLQNTFVKYIMEWKSDVQNNHKGENKRILALPTLEGLIFTTRNFVELAKRLLNEPDIKYICFGLFTQDVLEAFFGNLRRLGSSSQNPDVSQVAYGFNHILQRKCIKKLKGGNTTHGTINAWTTVSDEPVIYQHKNEKKSLQ